MKIVLIPLDDRPCNLYFPKILPYGKNKLVVTPKSIMGNMKRKANINNLKMWITRECMNANYLVLSLDTLVYGGLIPSRLHHKEVTELINNLEFVKEIKNQYPDLKIYAFITIMRTPNSNYDSEEPTYYKKYGKMLFRLGQLIHKEKINQMSEKEILEFIHLKKKIPASVVDDYIGRKRINLQVVKAAYNLYLNKYFDYFYIPQDDSNPYGFTRLDQMEMKKYMKEHHMLVPNFPGADEVGMVLLARTLNDYYQVVPKVYVEYASVKGPYVIPSFEDRMVDITINEQIMAIGGVRVYSLKEADLVLAVNIGGEMLYFPKEEERIIPYDIERNLASFIHFIKYAKDVHKLVGVADIAIPTGADLELVQLLNKEKMLLSVDAYASWNTASNTIGNVLSELSLFNVSKDKKQNLKFLIHRYYDDVGYCSYARTWTDINAALALGYNEGELDSKKGIVTNMTKQELSRYMKEVFPSISKYVLDLDVYSPWNRTFEMQFTLKYNEKLIK